MARLRKIRLRRYKFHPVTTFILLTILVMIVSSILSRFNVQVTYSTIDSTGELEKAVVPVKGLFNSTGFKYLVSNVAKNFGNFVPLSSLLIALIGLSAAKASGLIDVFIKRIASKLKSYYLTFIIIFVATISSTINDVGYVILIPLATLLFEANGRNPLLGITAAFCGVAFGYDATLFAGATEIALVPITETAARVVDPNFHVSMLSNLYAIIFASIVLSIVGTLVIEKFVAKKIGRYKSLEDIKDETKEIKLENVEEEEQKRLEKEFREKKGLKYALIATIVVVLGIAYMIIPKLPLSGLLLDDTKKAYIDQLFGENSYFQSGFTFIVSAYFFIVGIAYGIGAKSLKNDKDLIEKATDYLKNTGYLVLLVFAASQFIAIFKESCIGDFVVGSLSNVLIDLKFTGIPLVVTVLVFVFISGLFLTTQTSKWTILSPVVVPLLMRANLSPQFAQLIFRAGDSMSKGFTPLLAYFVIFLAYLNVYNTENESISIRKALSFISTYALIIGVTWLLIILFFYLVGLPIGPGVYVTL